MSKTMQQDEVDSLREWLKSWGDGPNWADATGAMVPITKASLLRLFDSHDRLRAAVSEARSYVLDHMVPGERLSRLTTANLATMLDQALTE